MKMDSITTRLPYFIGVILISVMIVPGNMRRHKENSYLALDKVEEDKKMLQSYVINTFSNVTLYECLINCILSPPCQAINILMDGGSCETLRSSTLVTEDILERKTGWMFYETDSAKQNNGHYCEEFSSCPATHICDDTYETPNSYETPNPYTCRCEEHFQGESCQEYIGPGSHASVPAGSCHLLKRKHEKIANGYYWLRKDEDDVLAVKEFCEMSEGIGTGLRNRTAIPSCDWLKENYPRHPSQKYWMFKDDDQKIVFEEECDMLWDKSIDEAWGQWSNGKWSMVERGGKTTRTRSCNDPAQSAGGAHCRNAENKEADEEKEGKECINNKCSGQNNRRGSEKIGDKRMKKTDNGRWSVKIGDERIKETDKDSTRCRQKKRMEIRKHRKPKTFKRHL